MMKQCSGHPTLRTLTQEGLVAGAEGILAHPS